MSFLPGLIIGGAIGAAIAWLTTPRTGQRNRELLKERGIYLGARVDEMLPGTSELLAERARAVIEEQRQRLQRAAEEARRATEEARQRLTERYESAKRGEPPPERD